MLTDDKSICCNAIVRWLDCEEHGNDCTLRVCTECGADA